MEEKKEIMDYQLVIKIPLKAMDNIQARQMAQELTRMFPVSKDSKVKLQRLQENKEPIGVDLD